MRKNVPAGICALLFGFVYNLAVNEKTYMSEVSSTSEISIKEFSTIDLGILLKSLSPNLLISLLTITIIFVCLTFRGVVKDLSSNPKIWALMIRMLTHGKSDDDYYYDDYDDYYDDDYDDDDDDIRKRSNTRVTSKSDSRHRK